MVNSFNIFQAYHINVKYDPPTPTHIIYTKIYCHFDNKYTKTNNIILWTLYYST